MDSWRMASIATLHCLTGCAIGEVLGMVISTALVWSTAPSIALSIVFAFIFGYSLTIWGLGGHSLSLSRLITLALIADTLSIAVMEIVDNAFILAVPGAIHATLDSWLFWFSLAISLVIAYLVALPVNRWLILRGKGHAAVHNLHHNHDKP